MVETSAEPSSHARSGRRSRAFRLCVAGVAVVVVGAAAAVTTTLAAGGGAHAAGPAVTVAGSAPSLTAGRGAAVPFVEQEAANAKTNGTVLAESRAWDTLAGEAVGRRAVTLRGKGKYVEFTLTQPANSINVRYSIPDSADGSPYTASLSVYADDVKVKTLSLTNKYSWYYGAYPFVNKPSNNPHHFYDEAHTLLGKDFPAGAKVRLQVDDGDTAAAYTIDLADFEEVAPPLPQPANSVSVTEEGADPTGAKDSTGAFEKAIAKALATGAIVWVPPGRFHVTKHLVVSNNTTIEGAGPWHSVIFGDGIGIYGNTAPHPSLNVRLSDFAIEGAVDERDDGAQLNGIGGGMGGGSVITNLWIEHTKVGIWLDGPFDGLTIARNRIDNLAADGINLHDGVTHATVTGNFIRNTGDDGIATWSEHDADTDNVISFNTVEVPVLANNIAIYGGADNAVIDNVVSDTQTQGGGIHVANRFNAVELSGTTTIARDTALRTGVLDPNWRYGVGALWFWANDAPMKGAIRVRDVDLIDSSYEGIEFAGSSVGNVSFDGVRIAGAGTFALQLESHGDATFHNVVATDIGAPAPIYDCLFTGSSTPAFSIADLGGNSGWSGKYCGKWPNPVRHYRYSNTEQPDTFDIAVSPPSGSITAGGAARVTVQTSVRSGGSQPLRLRVGGAPPGVDVRLSATSLSTGGAAVLTLAASGAAQPGHYPITVTADAPSGRRTATLTLAVAAASGPLAASPTTLSFDGQSVAEPSDPQEIRLTNTGTKPVRISSIRTTGDYTRTTTCGEVLPPGLSCAVDVTLDATGAGTRTGALIVSDDENPVTVRLSGSAAASSNLALNKAASASGTQDGYPASNMTDGNTGSYWESANNAFPQSATVDLGAVASVSRLVLTLPPPSAWTARVQTFTVLASVDGEAFTTIVPSGDHKFDPATGNTVAIEFPAVKARYLKIEFTANTGWPAAQVSEFEVFEQAAR